MIRINKANKEPTERFKRSVVARTELSKARG